MTHGTLGGYVHHHCRCDECRAAYAGYKRDYNARRRQPTEVSWGILAEGCLPMAPLEAAMAKAGTTIWRTHINSRWVARWRATGIPWHRADAMACAIGLHPSEIWGEDWWNAA